MATASRSGGDVRAHTPVNLRVALDARAAQVPFSGVGRGVRSLFQAMQQQQAPGVELLLLSSAGRPPVTSSPAELQLATPWPGNYSTWLQWSVPRWLSNFEGVFHCPHYALPVRQPVPMVVTLHDLTFESHPHWFTFARGTSYRLQARWAARTARMVVTPSRHVADVVAATYGVPERKIHVVPNGVDPVFRSHRRSVPSDPPYIVAMGEARRRRLDLAIDAWRMARQRGMPHQLVVLGRDVGIREPGLRFAGQLEDAAWAGLLGGAGAFLYTTEYEGYGMPAAEACTTGTPVVAARSGALPEVLGEAGHWAKELTAAALATALLEALEAGEQGRLRAARHADGLPTWQDAARLLLAGYQAAA